MAEETLGSDINTMIPTPRMVSVTTAEGKVDVEVKQIKVKQLPGVMQSIAPFIGFFKSQTDFDVQVMLIHYPSEIMTMLSVIMDKPVSWFDNMEVDELVDLVTAVVEVNLDFFTQRVLPSVLKAMGRLQGDLGNLLPSVGQTSSKNSLQEGTGSTTS